MTSSAIFINPRGDHFVF